MGTQYINKLSNSGFHVLTEAEAQALISIFNANNLKEAGTEHWLADNTGTNESLATILGAGERDETGAFVNYKGIAHLWLADEASDDTKAKALRIQSNSADIIIADQTKTMGLSVRMAMDNPAMYTEGMTMTDADGNVYDLVHIQSGDVNLVITKQNLATTKYADGTPISQCQSAEAWLANADGAYCTYDNVMAIDVAPTVSGEISSWFDHSRRFGIAVDVNANNLATTVELYLNDELLTELDGIAAGVTDNRVLTHILDSLTPGVYTWHIEATNSAGTTVGSTQTFEVYAGTNRVQTKYDIEVMAGITLFIDPSAEVNGIGTIESPFNTWPESLSNSRKYLQKAGTTANFTGSFSSIKGQCTIGSYGTGTTPVLHCTAVDSDDTFSFIRADYKVIIKDINISKADITGIGVYLVNVPGSTLYGCDISGFDRPIFTQAGGTALTQTWEGVKILYCSVHGCGTDGLYFRYTTGIEVAHCYIYDVNRSYLKNTNDSVSDGCNIKAETSESLNINIHHCTFDHSSMGNMGNISLSSLGTTVNCKHNHFIGSRSFTSSPVYGIKIPSPSTLAIMFGNIFEQHNIAIINEGYNTNVHYNLFIGQNKCIVTGVNRTLTAYNNVFYDYAYTAIERLLEAYMTAKNNVFKATAQAFNLSGSGKDIIDFNHYDGCAKVGSNTSSGDALFTDLANKDFYPQQSSPIKNIGTNVGLTLDFGLNNVTAPINKGIYE